MLGISLGTVGTRRSVVQGVQWFRGGCSSSNETNIERKVVDCKKGAKTRLGPNYSYHRILIVEGDTAYSTWEQTSGVIGVVCESAHCLQGLG